MTNETNGSSTRSPLYNLWIVKQGPNTIQLPTQIKQLQHLTYKYIRVLASNNKLS